MARDGVPTTQITVRIPTALADRITSLVAKLARPGAPATMTTVVREALTRGVGSLEAEVSPKKGAAR